MIIKTGRFGQLNLTEEDIISIPGGLLGFPEYKRFCIVDPGDDILIMYLQSLENPDFAIANPNRLRSLAGTFGVNHWAFHSPDGRGYAFLTDMILAADKLNPQVAARLVTPFGKWRRFEPKRSALMRESIARIAGAPELSKDVYEQASKILG